MKQRRCFSHSIYLLGLLLSTGCAPGGGGVGSLPAPTVSCNDGAVNGNETDVDCGGACGQCDLGEFCAVDADCSASHCSSAGLCTSKSCTNGRQDLDEDGVDCGGACASCIASSCSDDSKCQSGYCSGGQCSIPTCVDGATNGSEGGVDCGGECPLCADGQTCRDSTDCVSAYCHSGICACLPDCDGKSCGDDGCGGVCGNCLPGEVCDAANTCEQAQCIPDCSGKTCGLDGCGSTCGSCFAGETCEIGNCELVANPCPSPVITVQEGDEVIPQTVLHLSGTQSTSDNGPVASYAWTVDQPAGAVGQFSPSVSAASPTFTVSLAGTYVFTLAVVGPNGPVVGCPNATFTVIVLTDNAIEVELVWDTPNDLNKTDTGPYAGADLDLHFAHQFAVGVGDNDYDGEIDPWFDSYYDCFSSNLSPNWGDFHYSAGDDPSLNDNVDGSKPESISLDIPETGRSYKVGVHYWDDHGFGPSLATVRVYIFGALAAEFESGSMHSGDFWGVATVAWPAGTVTPSTANDGGPFITPYYPNPIFPN